MTSSITQTHRWGHSEYLYAGPAEAIARAVGKRGGASSRHFHRHKNNAFLVVEGCLLIELDGHSIVLRQGDCVTIPAGQRHRMEFQTDAVVLEVYTALPSRTVELNDIVRLDEGRVPSAAGNRPAPAYSA